MFDMSLLIDIRNDGVFQKRGIPKSYLEAWLLRTWSMSALDGRQSWSNLGVDILLVPVWML